MRCIFPQRWKDPKNLEKMSVHEDFTEAVESRRYQLWPSEVSVANTNFGQTNFGQHQLWPNQVWPVPTLGKTLTKFGQTKFGQTITSFWPNQVRPAPSLANTIFLFSRSGRREGSSGPGGPDGDPKGGGEGRTQKNVSPKSGAPRVKPGWEAQISCLFLPLPPQFSFSLSWVSSRGILPRRPPKPPKFHEKTLTRGKKE